MGHRPRVSALCQRMPNIFSDPVVSTFPVSVKYLGQSQDASINTMDDSLIEKEGFKSLRCLPTNPILFEQRPIISLQNHETSIFHKFVGFFNSDVKQPRRFRRSLNELERTESNKPKKVEKSTRHNVGETLSPRLDDNDEYDEEFIEELFGKITEFDDEPEETENLSNSKQIPIRTGWQYTVFPHYRQPPYKKRLLL